MTDTGFNPDVTLGALFRHNIATRSQAIALRDSDGKTYTYDEANRAVLDLTAQLCALGMPPRSSVVLLLPNGSELALSMLAVMFAGHIPVPAPVAYRKSDLVRVCREAEAAALITTASYGEENLPLLATEVAMDVFELSFPCAFGATLPDGVVPLTMSHGNETKAAASASPAEASGIATLQVDPNGPAFIHHRDPELLAAGLASMLASDVQGGDQIVCATSLASYAGLASAVAPWLLSGGTLTLLSDIPEVSNFHTGSRLHLVAAAGSLLPLARQLNLPLASATAVHFAGTWKHTNFVALSATHIVDSYALHELAAITLRRAVASAPQPIPLGVIHAGQPSATSPHVLETMIAEDRHILVRGALAPTERAQDNGWVDTGFVALTNGPESFHAKAPDGLFAVGSLRFQLPELERRILSAALVSNVSIEQDAVLGSRIVIESERPVDTATALLNAGLPRVIANAVRKSEARQARSA